ncbi:MAG: zf-HC2 domain-containing protein [Ignavibacteriaceae bacterium]
MKHKDIKSKLILYLDGELPEKEMEEIKLHLDDCAECTSKRDLIVSHWKKENIKQELPSPFLWTKIEARIKEYEQTSKFIWDFKEAFRFVVMHPVTTAIAVIAIAAGIYLGTPAVNRQSTGHQMQTSSLNISEDFELNVFRIVPDNELGSSIVNPKQTRK